MPDAALSLYEREEIGRGLIEDPGESWAELGRLAPLGCRCGY